jgi:hypothetical protein
MITPDINDLPTKGTTSGGDYVVIVDSDDTSRLKKVAIAALPAGGGGGSSYVTSAASTATVGLSVTTGTLTATVLDSSLSPAKLNFDPATQVELDAHANNLSNPHVVTATQIGLNAVPNVDATQRANHTGTQIAATISDFSEAVDDRVDALVSLGSGLTKTYNDTSNSYGLSTVFQPLAQTMSYAATITADAALGSLVKIGPLTGAITIAAPLNPVEGWSLIYYLKQDATGGRVVTWNSVFKYPPVIDATAPANAQDIAAFVYVDSSWVRSRV